MVIQKALAVDEKIEEWKRVARKRKGSLLSVWAKAARPVAKKVTPTSTVTKSVTPATGSSPSISGETPIVLDTPSNEDGIPMKSTPKQDELKKINLENVCQGSIHSL